MGCDLRIVPLNHDPFGIAAICIELAGNSQKWAESTRRYTQLIGPAVNNEHLSLEQSRLSTEIADARARWAQDPARR
jgi:hypothetical protein